MYPRRILHHVWRLVCIVVSLRRGHYSVYIRNENTNTTFHKRCVASS